MPHHVRMDFRGADQDGFANRFEYIVETYPKSISQYSEITVQTPADADPRWKRIEAFNVELVLAADTLRADPRDDIGDGRFDRWHTFFVRAIDNEGGADPTPAVRTFNAFTLAPTLLLLPPAEIGRPAELPSSFVLDWNGSDDVGNGIAFQDPLDVRWVFRPATLNASGRPIGFPEALYDLTEADWSDWLPWDLDAGNRVALLDVLSQFPGDSTFVFALQGRDDGGAITPQFADVQPNNMAVIRVRSDLPVGPLFSVRETQAGLGSWSFDGQGSPTVIVDATGTATVTLEWGPMTVAHYGARTGDWRWAWNIGDPFDPGNENLWSTWSDATEAPPRDLTTTSEKFLVQARDDVGVITTAIVLFTSSGR
ncbi:MAG: hypothetical protein JSW67_13905 [Candidatus Latescibacterota bacterium]|nr:MAG: hypothetical protein JSW67_13905 [Candidatus Latescibacterota bacterium]